MYKKMDEIMEIMHQIALYLSDYATAEMNGKTITKEQIEKNKILETLFIRVQKAYRELKEMISKDAKWIDGFYEIENDIDDGKIISTLDMQKPESLISDTINDLDEYLENAYLELRYISLYNGEEKEISSSIYKNTKFEALRNSEYNLQGTNLEYLSIRNNIKNPIGEFSFSEKGDILSHITQCEFYDNYAFRQINEYIADFAKKSSDIDEEKYKTIMDKLIEQKYILYFSYLNNKYNGILQENDTGKLAVVKKCLDEGLETMLLGMTKFEIEENIKANLLEYKKEFKEVIKDILDKENISSKKIKGKSSNSKKLKDEDIKNIIKMEDKDEVKIDDKPDSER